MNKKTKEPTALSDILNTFFTQHLTNQISGLV